MEDLDVNIITDDEGKKKLNIIDEFKVLKRNLEYFRKCMDMEDLIEVDLEYIETLKFKSENRIRELIENANKWNSNASVFDKLTTITITTNDKGNYISGIVGAKLEDVLKEKDIQQNKELMNKIDIFMEECFNTVDSRMNIKCNGKLVDGNFICEEIGGVYKSNDELNIAYMNFKTGKIEEKIGNKSIVDSKLPNEQTHSISEIESTISDRKVEDLSKIVKEIADKIEQKEEEKGTQADK